MNDFHKIMVSPSDERRKKEVITRFAPSPTGSLHIGGIRTAIFNWAFAKKHNGSFILRIDDTDKKRHQEKTINQIFKDFEWLGLDYDYCFRQSDNNRQDCYKEVANLLIKKKRAYVVGQAVCLKVIPQEIIIDDVIHGSVKFNTVGMHDPVLIRANGDPLYRLTSVVDDIDMNVTHIIRGDEHISNTVTQLLIYQAMECYGERPFFAHIPFICPPNSKKKLSKRDNVDVTLDAYKRKGYLPEALKNYLQHLGWAFDGEKEIWSEKEFIDNFSLKSVVKKPAQLDFKKLEWIQGQYMNKLSIDEKIQGIRRHVVWASKERELVEAIGDRLTTFSSILKYRHFWNDAAFEFNTKDLEKKVNKPGIVELLKSFRDSLQALDELQALPNDWWDKKRIESLLKEYCEEANIKPSKLIHALRVATTGSMVGFGLYEGFSILGKQRTIERIDNCIAQSRTLSN